MPRMICDDYRQASLTRAAHHREFARFRGRRLIARDLVTLCIDSRFPPPASPPRPPSPDPAGRPATGHRFDLLMPPSALPHAD